MYVPSRALTCLFVTPAFIGCADEPRPEYDARLATEAVKLAVCVTEDEVGLVHVSLSGSYFPSDGCPRFRLVGRANGELLELLDPGGHRSTSRDAFGDSDEHCTMPVFEWRHDDQQPRPAKLTLELEDGSATFTTIVIASSERPQVVLEIRGVARGGSLDCILVPQADEHAVSALIIDSLGEGHLAQVTGRDDAESGIAVRIPHNVAVGPAQLQITVANWIAPRVIRCDGPNECQVTLREALAGFEERSRAGANVDVLEP